MNKVIISEESLDNVALRLVCCSALLDAIRDAMRDDDPAGDAVWAVHDLLECIHRDFRADIDAAEDYIKEGTGAA